MTVLVSLQGASVNFGAVQALRPLDLLLHRGDRLALVGANGSGKTTLLRLLNGQIWTATDVKKRSSNRYSMDLLPDEETTHTGKKGKVHVVTHSAFSSGETGLASAPTLPAHSR